MEVTRLCFPPRAYPELKDPKALIEDKASGCPSVLLESSDGKLFLWNQISNDVWRILAPKKLEELVPKLATTTMDGVELENLDEPQPYDVEPVYN